MRILYSTLIFLLLSIDSYLYFDLKKLQKKIRDQESDLVECQERLIIYRLQREVSSIRGLRFLKPVPYKTMDRVEVKKLVQERLENELTVQDERILKKFGFLRPNEEILSRLSGLYEEQVQGMYDEEKGEMVIVKGTSVTGNLQRMFLVHELTHALQDQNFILKDLPLRGENDDMALASLSLVEGDATLVMFRYYKRHLRLFNVLWDILSYLSVDQGNFYSSPYYIRENLIFPYKCGIRFLAGRTWEEINELYEKLPKSTEQIIHPEKYPTDEPIEVSIQEVLEGWELLDTNTMGEFNIRVLLSIYLGEYESVAPATGWGGDKWQVWEEVGTGKLRVIWYIIWDTRADAIEFFNAFKKVVKKRYPDVSGVRLIRRGRWVRLYW